MAHKASDVCPSWSMRSDKYTSIEALSIDGSTWKCSIPTGNCFFGKAKTWAWSRLHERQNVGLHETEHHVNLCNLAAKKYPCKVTRALWQCSIVCSQIPFSNWSRFLARRQGRLKAVYLTIPSCFRNFCPFQTSRIAMLSLLVHRATLCSDA